MKTAKTEAALVRVLCPDCGEPVPNPQNGNREWAPTQVHEVAHDPLYREPDHAPMCEQCGCFVDEIELPEWLQEAVEAEVRMAEA